MMLTTLMMSFEFLHPSSDMCQCLASCIYHHATSHSKVTGDHDIYIHICDVYINIVETRSFVQHKYVENNVNEPHDTVNLRARAIAGHILILSPVILVIIVVDVLVVLVVVIIIVVRFPKKIVPVQT